MRLKLIHGLSVFLSAKVSQLKNVNDSKNSVI
jgi:hypothetical protein